MTFSGAYQFANMAADKASKARSATQDEATKLIAESLELIAKAISDMAIEMDQNQ